MGCSAGGGGSLFFSTKTLISNTVSKEIQIPAPFPAAIWVAEQVVTIVTIYYNLSQVSLLQLATSRQLLQFVTSCSKMMSLRVVTNHYNCYICYKSVCGREFDMRVVTSVTTCNNL